MSNTDPGELRDKHAARGWLATAELLRRLETVGADPGLRDDLARLAGETTDDLDENGGYGGSR